MIVDNYLLANIEYIPYIDENGQLPEQFQGKIGVYAVFDRDQELQFVGYSRDVYLSLKQHLVRQPQYCYWVKIQTIERPSRTLLENIEKAWIEDWITQNSHTPSGCAEHKNQWTQAINVKELMTPEENANYNNPIHDEIARIKIIKNVARRIEAEILKLLQMRGLQTEIRFNPKLKEEGLLDLKS
ncbi:hypothetical protein NIES4101_47040 [Calothrix sp. NIES-4101]|nr:hypothetical protein NIES4101_47040 [Calothrix sp. NIES-4101]